MISLNQVLDQALTGLGTLDPGDAQGLTIEGRGSQIGELLNLPKLIISDGPIGKFTHSSGLTEKSGDLVLR